MNEFDEIAPCNPTPVGPGAFDQYGNARPGPVESAGRGPYILLGILVAAGVIGGLLYFTQNPATREQQAQAPMSRPPSLHTPTITPAPVGNTESRTAGAHTAISGAATIPDGNARPSLAPSTGSTTQR